MARSVCNGLGTLSAVKPNNITLGGLSCCTVFLDWGGVREGAIKQHLALSNDVTRYCRQHVLIFAFQTGDCLDFYIMRCEEHFWSRTQCSMTGRKDLLMFPPLLRVLGLNILTCRTVSNVNNMGVNRILKFFESSHFALPVTCRPP